MGRVRLIGGEWRGRVLAVAEAPGLRPTGDRVRETLFNWLQPSVGGARCADLFAGSGALGLEAASRGAASVVLVERDTRVADTLVASLEALGAGSRVRLERCSARAFLDANTAPFDLVFVDPPFEDAAQETILGRLVTSHLADDALVYVEAPRGPLALPEALRVHRERTFGDVTARLLHFRARHR